MVSYPLTALISLNLDFKFKCSVLIIPFRTTNSKRQELLGTLKSLGNLSNNFTFQDLAQVRTCKSKIIKDLTNARNSKHAVI